MKLHTLVFTLTLLSIAACKKELAIKEDPAAIEFAACPVYPSVVHSFSPSFTYTADVKNPTNEMITGRVQLFIIDENNVADLVNEKPVTLVANDVYFYSYSGEIAISSVYEPANFKFRLNFVNSSDGITKIIGGNSCSNPSSFTVKDTLSGGTATATFVNARYDSVPTNFVYLGETLATNVPPLSSVTGFQIQSGSGGFNAVDIAPGAYVTCFEVKTQAGYTQNAVASGNPVISNPAKAYVQYVHTTDAGGTAFTVQKNGVDVPEFKQKAFLEFSDFVPFDPGITNFLFKPDFVSATVGLLDINLEQGKFYTIYQAGYINPGFSQNVKAAQYIQHN